MTISYSWLIDYLPEINGAPKPDPERLSKILTGIGLEVESLSRYQQIPGGLEGLVIGNIVEVMPHPNADRLKLTRVDVGAETPLQIVCGAPNVTVGQQVVVAPVGTTIYPLNEKSVTMKKAKIRGEASFGMMCAEDEIGLGDSHEGIMSLDGRAQPGMKARDYFEITEDWIYEIGLTPNRMDAMSHIGVARDVCAKLSHATNKRWDTVLPSIDNFKVNGNNNNPIKISIENEDACPRYSGVVLSEIKIGKSPRWLQDRLNAVGVRPINNVVDITNYILHECGQPLHAFDMDAVKGRHIKVKNLPEGTSFVTLDKESRKLQDEDLMICNIDEPMCIAGVFGGLYSGVTEKTTSIFLESACFDSVSVRRTSIHHGLRTDAATRFEKGVDISGVIYALKRAASLMIELCGARVESEIVDCYPRPREKTKIELKKAYLNKLSGKEFSLGQVEDILVSLGFEMAGRGEESITVSAPFNKPDMAVGADLVEEIMRIDGYENIEIPTHIRIAPSVTNTDTARERQKEKIAAYLSDNGFYEVLTNSITNSRYYNQDRPLVRLMNNLSRELDVMKPSMLETGLEAVAYNLNRKQENIHFFEMGKIYAPGKDPEKPVLAIWSSGKKYPGSWVKKEGDTDPYFLKGHLQNLFIRLGIPQKRLTFVPVENAKFHNAIELRIDNSPIGKLGMVAKKDLKHFGIKQEVWYAETDLTAVVKYSMQQEVTFQDIAKYPVIKRDLALVLDKKVNFSAVENVAKKIKTCILEEINLFDVFEGEKLGANKKSYAVSFVFRHPKKTLTDHEIDKVMSRLIQSFEQQLGAEIRS